MKELIRKVNMLRTLQQWYDRCDKGTSGDMVYDILRDWKEEKEKLEAEK
jgi:hypothetical protein